MIANKIVVEIPESSPVKLNDSPTEIEQKLGENVRFLRSVGSQALKVFALKSQDWKQIVSNCRPNTLQPGESLKLQSERKSTNWLVFLAKTVSLSLNLWRCNPISWRHFYRK